MITFPSARRKHPNIPSTFEVSPTADSVAPRRANSLVPGDLYDPTQTRFGEIDRTGYDAVAGNPPYIRAERSTELEVHAREYFAGTRERNGKTFQGVTVGGNAYTLFIYRALDHWCRQPGADGPVGKLGFIVPLAFCGSDEASDLRALFATGRALGDS